MGLELFNHLEYQVGGVIVAIIILLLLFGLSLTTLILIAVLAFGAGYLFWGSEQETSWREETPAAAVQTDTEQTSSYSNDSTDITTRSGKTKAWKVTIGKEHTPSSVAYSPDIMDRSGNRSRLLEKSSSLLSMTPGNLSSRSGLASPGSQTHSRRASLGLSPGPGASGLPLPRVRRVHDSYTEGGSSRFSPGYGRTPPSAAHSAGRRYPTHQPKYAGLGLLPPVHLHSPDRRVLTERNTSMLKSPVTVKIAPPDILKPPIPSIVPVEEPPEPDTTTEHNPCDTQNVLTAIREKRKRTLKEDEEVIPVIDRRDSKRRRQNVSTEYEENVAKKQMSETQDRDSSMETTAVSSSSLKRPAISRTRAASISEMEETTTKRSRSLDSTASPATPGSISHVRNPIEVSYSSSKRWIEKQQELEKSEGQRNKRRQIHSQSREGSAKKTKEQDSSIDSTSRPSHHLSPRRILSLVDQDTPMKDESSIRAAQEKEPAPSTSKHTENAAADEAKTPDVNDPSIKGKLFPLPRDSSSRRRHTQIRSDSNTEFSKVPTLRYSLTTEDYEKDRMSEMKRVEQMLEDVEEAHAAKTAAKSESKVAESKVAASVTTSVSTSLLSATTKTSTSTAKASPLSGLGVTSSTSKSDGGTVTKPLSITSPLTLGGVSTQATSVASASSSKAVANTQAISATTTSSLATPLLQTGQSSTASGSSSAAPASTSVNTQFKLPTGGSQISSTGTLGSAPSVTAPDTSNSTQPTSVATSQFSFPPLFGNKSSTSQVTGSSATSVTPSSAVTLQPASQPQSSSTSNTAASLGANPASTGGFSFGAAATSAASTASSITSSTPSSQFSFGSSTSATSNPSSVGGAASTASSVGLSQGTATTTSITGGFTFGQAGKPTTAPSSAPSTTPFSFGTQAASSSATPAFGSTLGSSTAATGSFGTTSSASTSSLVPAFGSAATTTSASSLPAFGTGSMTSTAPAAFGSSSTNTFGSANLGSATTTASTGFMFGATSATANAGSSFNAPSSTPIMFGQGGNTTTITSSSTSTFGQNAATAATPAFGQAATTVSSTSGSIFGGGKPSTGAIPTFGAASGQTNGQPKTTGFQFGVAAPKTEQKPTASTTFQFGATGSTSTATQPSPFAFGSQSSSSEKPSVITFGQPKSTAAPAFGTTATTNNAFGSGGSNAFGTSSSSSTAFGSAAPAFGQSTNMQNAFGTNNQTSTAFGTTAPQTQPAFGAGTQNAFGTQQPASTAFGTTTSTQASKGFDFSASTKPTFNFGGASQPAQPAQPTTQAGFAFGSNTNQSNTGFNFNAGGGGAAFGMTAPGTPQQQPPAFGAPNATPTGTPNPFAPATPAGFTVGSGNTQPRPRSVARAARRRTTKR